MILQKIYITSIYRKDLKMKNTKEKLKYKWDDIEVSKKEFFLKLKELDKNYPKRENVKSYKS